MFSKNTILLCSVLSLATTAVAAPSFVDDESLVAKALQEDGLYETATTWSARILVLAIPKDPSQAIRRYSFSGLYSDTNGNGLMDQEDAAFFNPASTIKVGVAAAVLEFLHERDIPRSSEFRAEGETEWHTFERDISEMLVLSDNDATNRLIRFLGFQELNQRIRSRGIDGWELGRLMISKEVLGASVPHEVRNGIRLHTVVPQAVTMTSSCQETPTQNGNCATPEAQAGILLRLSHPERFEAGESFAFPEETRAWFLGVMRSYPRDIGFDPEKYPDSSCRALFPLQQDLFTEHRIASKCGYAPYTVTISDISYMETNGAEDYISIIGTIVRPSYDPPPTREEGQKAAGFIGSAARAVLSRLK